MRKLGHEYKRSMQALNRDIWLWGGSVVLLAVIVLALWPALERSGTLGSFTQGLSPEVAKAMGLDGFDTAAGYLKGNLYAVILPLVVGFFGITATSGLLASDESAGRMELLYSLPVSRFVVTLARIGGVITGLVVCGVALAVSVIIGMKLTDMNLGANGVLAITAGVTLLGAFHAALAYMISGITPKAAMTLGGASTVLILGYLLEAVIGLVPNLTWLVRLSPWHWALGGDPLTTGWHWGNLALLLGGTVLFIVIGSLAVQRRDLANA